MYDYIDLAYNPDPAFEKNNIPIALSASNYYVPYLSVVIESIISNSQKKYNYDLLILNKDITEDNKILLTLQCKKKNVKIRFYNVSEFFKEKNFFVGNVSVESYFRVILPDILKKYKKIIFLDCDVIVNNDIVSLYEENIDDVYLGATRDINLIACYHIKNHWKPYLDNKLHLKNPYDYFQAGVMLVNLEKIRQDFSDGILLEVCASEPWKLLDQDVLNMLLQKKIKILDLQWNLMTGEEGRYDHVIKNAPQYMSEEYLRARKKPNIIHFCGKKKPWSNTEVEYASYFWKYARKTPFYELILQRNIYGTVNNLINLKNNVKKDTITSSNIISKNVQTIKKEEQIGIINFEETRRNTKKYVLFRILTVYQLINAIQLKLTKLKHIKVDIILSSATDFSNIVSALKTQRIFDNIYMSNDTPNDYFKWKQQSEITRINMLSNPEKFLYPIDLNNTYTDYYIATVDPYNQLFYYYLVKSGHRPQIHLFEDGLSSYLIDYGKDDSIWKHSLYKEYNFFENIKELLLYDPDLYMVNGVNYTINSISKINCENKYICNLFNSIFGKNLLPKEQYIFLEEPFMWDGITATDMDLVDMLAEIVGKENIRVKLHPRNGIDRFSPRGYKIFEQSKIPWEMSIMNSNLTDKIIITISSTAAFTAGLVFGKEFRSINLFDLILIGKTIHVNNPKFKQFYSKLEEKMNGEKIQIFKPTTILEMKECLTYAKGESL